MKNTLETDVDTLKNNMLDIYKTMNEINTRLTRICEPDLEESLNTIITEYKAKLNHLEARANSLHVNLDTSMMMALTDAAESGQMG
jgi:hypothetical protein